MIVVVVLHAENVIGLKEQIVISQVVKTLDFLLVPKVKSNS